MKEEYEMLYQRMATSGRPEYMKVFGSVMSDMMGWVIANKPDLAKEWIEKLQSIKWKNYLTKNEAENIVSKMNPKAPWSRDQWLNAMEKHGFPLEKEPCYNKCALYTAMNMVMSDSSATLLKYVGEDELFSVIYDLAVDKLTDKDEVFKIREYFKV